MRSSFLISGICFLFLNLISKAQSVAINNDWSLPSAGAILDVKSSDKGILIPRITLRGTDDVTTVPELIESLLIYNARADGSGSNAVYPGYYYWNRSLWVRLTTNDNSLSSGWLLGGNAGTSPSTHFLGTTDNNSLLFKVNNQRAGYVGVEASDGNVFWGYHSGNNNTGFSNVGIGVKALYTNTNITNLVAVGDFSLFSNTTGSDNTAIGSKSLYSNTSGFSNTANGLQALYRNTTGYQNTANGVGALFSNTTGTQNTANGTYALLSNTTGIRNTASGVGALFINTTGSSNTANGYGVLYNNTTGSTNTANGYEALYSNTTGSENMANGFRALYNNTTGSNNTANGYSALHDNITGIFNTANGQSALFSNTTGNRNTADGQNALLNNKTGFNNTALGYFSDVSYDSLNNATAIGYNAKVDASDKVRIGNSSVTVIEGQVPFSSPSDGRFKFNIRDDVSGLDFIMKLRPITYQFDVKRFDENLRSSLPGKENNYAMEASYQEASAIRRTGFIAQEVEKAANETGYDFSGIIKPKSEREHYGLSYESFVVPLVKGMQEQQQTITAQNKKIEELEKKLVEMQKQMDELIKFAHK